MVAPEKRRRKRKWKLHPAHRPPTHIPHPPGAKADSDLKAAKREQTKKEKKEKKNQA